MMNHSFIIYRVPSPPPGSALEVLQSHFSWDLNVSRSKMTELRYKMEDGSTEAGQRWLGHVYNLWGYCQYRLGFSEDARRLFFMAADAFRRTAGTDRGPWLVVNYGNQAWLHHLLGEPAECQAYLAKVSTLMSEHPPPSEDELHPEVLAEKAWTLMRFSPEKKLLAVDYLDRAIKMQPGRVEWSTYRVLGLASAFKNNDFGQNAEILEKMRLAMDQDPEDLYLAAHFLQLRAKAGQNIEEEVRELAGKVMKNPDGSIEPLLWIYVNHISDQEAMVLAEEVLEKHQDERYIWRCVALCYAWIITYGQPTQNQTVIERAIRVHEEVISLYPDSSLMKKIDLANIYRWSRHGLDRAEELYRDLLEVHMDAEEQQMLYFKYGRFLYYERKDHHQGVRYHMKAAEIPVWTHTWEKCIKILQRFALGNADLSDEINEFLGRQDGPYRLTED